MAPKSAGPLGDYGMLNGNTFLPLGNVKDLGVSIGTP